MASAIRTLLAGPAWREVIEGQAGRRAATVLRHTPLLPLPALARQVRAREAYVKVEGLQRTGSFKLRGAAARLAAMSSTELARGVVAASAGNHGLGVAFAARAFGLCATVVVPGSSAEVKRTGISALGAEILVQGAHYAEAEAHARALAEERGATYVSGFDDEHVMAGNGGGLGLEVRGDLPEDAGPGDLIVTPVGGGGLASGLGAALHETGAALVGVEPEQNCAMRRSFDQGSALTDYPEGRPTLAEGLEGPVSERTFQVCQEALADLLLVSEESIREAIAWAYRTQALVVEPSSAVALAGLLTGAVDAGGRRVVWIDTGSNIQPELLDEALRATL